MRQLLVPRFLLFCGLKRRAPLDRVWHCPSGIQVTGFGRHGPPFGRSRAIFLFLANQTAESGPAFRATFDDIAAMLGVTWRRCTFEEHFLRVVESTYQPGEPACGLCRVPPWSRRSLDVIRRAHYCEADGFFQIEVGDELVPHAHNSFTCPLGPVTELLQAGRLQALDLYLWYHWKLSRDDQIPVDPFGPDGPFGLAPIARASIKRRASLREAHATVTQIWPDCPFRIVGRVDDTMLACEPDTPTP